MIATPSRQIETRPSQPPEKTDALLSEALFMLETARDALHQLAAICAAANKLDDAFAKKHLLSLGQYHADDWAERCEHERKALERRA